ncbi:condensation domain-containing protein, partial [Microcoleus sp. Aus8_D3]|uniref:condensation domain-containing protein n=1 Tax=Microcoleus sp. Aus8_D3 TaxID=2818633 RepID=UPI002FD4A679
MSKTLGVDVRVADIFKYKTISGLLSQGLGHGRIEIPKLDTDRSVLSFAQERLWFIEQYEGGTNAYHIPQVYEVSEYADLEGLSYAINQVVSRHEVLRSTIELGADEKGIQIVHSEALLIEEKVLRTAEILEGVLREDINRPFDLSSEYPIRVKIYRINTEGERERVLLLINLHHIVSDGWSMEIFQKELLDYYGAYLRGDKLFSLAPLDIQYKDYSLWQRSYLSGEVLANQLSYWKKKLTGYSTLELPTDYVRPTQIDYRGGSEVFTLGNEISEKVRLLSRQYGVTVHSVLLSAMNVLLSKYTGQEDIVIGSPMANRHHRQTEGLIGFFVNSQVNRALLSKTQSYEELIQEVHRDQISGQAYQDLPFEKLVDELGVNRDTSRHPIFQVMFGVQSFGKEASGVEEKGHLMPYPGLTTYEVEKFDLSIFVDDRQELLMGRIGYASSLFKKETITRLIGHYLYLLEQLVESPQTPYSKISLLLPSEYKQIVYDWNATDKDYPSEKT